MEEIKVGEYVRTKKGYIAKVTSGIIYKELDRPVDFEKDSGCYYSGQDLLDDTNIIKKHSKNLIDLIEVGDYVSSKDGIEGKVDFVMLPLKIFVNGEEVLNDEIKSIVTHEQFAQIEYKVEEEIWKI